MENYDTKSKLALIGGVMVHLVLGSYYLWPNVVIYFTSYFRLHDNPDLTNAMANLTFPVMVLCQSCAMPFAMSIGNWIGLKVELLIGVVLIGSCIFISSFMTNFWVFIIFYGFIFGSVNGAMYIIPMKVGFLYFPHRKGMVSGLIVAGFGCGALLWSYVAQFAINPSNIPTSIYNRHAREHYFDASVTDNVPFGLRALAITYFIIAMTGALLIDFPTPEKAKIMEENLMPKEQSSLIQTTLCPSVKTGIKSLILYQVIFFTFLASCYGNMLVPNIKNYGRRHHKSDQLLTTIAAVGSLFNGLLRIVWGLLMDKFPYKVIILSNLVLQLILVSLIQSISKNPLLYGIWVCVTYICFGGVYAVQPTITMRIFGQHVGPVVYGLVFFGFGFGALFQFFYVKWAVPIYDWGFVFDTYLCIVLFAIFIGFVFKFSKDWTDETKEYEELEQSQVKDQSKQNTAQFDEEDKHKNK